MANPEVRARFLDAMAPSVAQLYGPEAAPQLAAGQTVQLPEADEAGDDQVIDGQATEADPEPSWFGTTTTAPEATAPTQTPAMRLAAVLREKAAGSGMVGPATVPQKERLQLVFKPLGLPATAKGLQVVFGLASLGDITGSQAQALIECAVDAEFGDLWRELVEAGAQAG
jgi:hypothetical protein